jgi:signal transduction histidine kinase
MASDLRKYVKELKTEKGDLLSLKTALEQRTKELEETILKVKNIQQELLRSEKFATIGRLASSIAHELRNPLASLKNISYYLIKVSAFNFDEKAKQMLDLLSIDVARANKIVTDLLDFSRIKRLNKAPTRIDELINNFGQNIHITRKLESIEASLDPDKLKQALLNIFSNSRDAMPEGGNITIKTGRKDSNISIMISDTGYGMDDETLSHIFDPLFSTKTRGLGLSLAIVKEVVDLHSGRIFVTSRKGEGTTFEILLPLN